MYRKYEVGRSIRLSHTLVPDRHTQPRIPGTSYLWHASDLYRVFELGVMSLDNAYPVQYGVLTKASFNVVVTGTAENKVLGFSC